MDGKDFLKTMKEEVLDTEMDLTMDTSLSDIEEWDSLSVVSFLAVVKKLNNKTGKNSMICGGPKTLPAERIRIPRKALTLKNTLGTTNFRHRKYSSMTSQRTMAMI